MPSGLSSFLDTLEAKVSAHGLRSEGTGRLTASIPPPLPHQIPAMQSTARFKLIRAGRRWGKSRLELAAGTAGHGGRPGILQGVDVVWLSPDYPQSRAIWREEIKPRFSGVAGVTLNEGERRVSIEGQGTLELRSAESIDSIRGRKLGGLLIDEAAFLDLEYAWPNVLRPALTDLEGWAIFGSTPKAGSYFNTLCERQLAGDLGIDWAQFVGHSRDNSALPAGEVEAMIAELSGQPYVVAQEIGAELLQGGAGKAFPEWRYDLHVIRQEVPPSNDWVWFAGMDWGYRAPGALIVIAENTKGRQLVRHEVTFRETPPRDVGQRLGRILLQVPHVSWVAYDQAMDAVTDGGPTVTDEVRHGIEDVMRSLAPPMIPAPKGPHSRVARTMLLHQALSWTETDGVVHDWQRPSMTFHPDCRETIRTLATLRSDEKKPEDVDTKGEDHHFDALTYALMVHRPTPAEEWPDVTKNRHPGFDEYGRRKNPARRWREGPAAEGPWPGMGYELPPSRD